MSAPRRESVPSSVATSAEVTLHLYDNGRGQFRYVYSLPGLSPRDNVRTWPELTNEAVARNESLQADARVIAAFTNNAVRLLGRSAFRIAFRTWRGGPYVAQVIDATDAADALKKLGSYYSVRSITVRCAGTKPDGSPCERFGVDDYCRAHAPKDSDVIPEPVEAF